MRSETTEKPFDVMYLERTDGQMSLPEAESNRMDMAATTGLELVEARHSAPETPAHDGDNIRQIRHWIGIAKQALDQDHRAMKHLNEAMHYVEQEERRYGTV